MESDDSRILRQLGGYGQVQGVHWHAMTLETSDPVVRPIFHARTNAMGEV